MTELDPSYATVIISSYIETNGSCEGVFLSAMEKRWLMSQLNKQNNDNKPTLVVVALSGGKDSSAMLLKMIEKQMQIDIILYCDVGLEFEEMYAHLDKLEQNINRPITRIRCEQSYEYLMFDTPVKRKENTKFSQRYGNIQTGYGWAGPRMRWCTSKLKDGPRERFLRPFREKYSVIEYVGIAADEDYRLERERNKNISHRHPLVDWGMTEADCLRYCYERGYDWGGLYERFKRVSCWACPLQSLPELRQLHKHYPELWAKAQGLG
jgi:3'-phosphoadenosine 5'-phosphosulfate sulfotransferase (PAPS reductase)/FAD synthetase